jgi:hypothetical protein
MRIKKLWKTFKQKMRMAGVQLPPDIESCRLLRKSNRRELVSMVKEEIRTGTRQQEFQESAIKEAMAEGN